MHPFIVKIEKVLKKIKKMKKVCNSQVNGKDICAFVLSNVLQFLVYADMLVRVSG